ncbi:serine hydrolase domain-containing protein [Tenggerimyces flavus]|uniref:Serine hydrolase domain-containing protein n=1 Tax=Tenggerimyces flavus TaxID=1708749 RepID=A0ABV7Y869_9ACTN|nr:serine hydrolase domain-containing protein [Tenggerimyces flavus]MBM7785457.1 CubicO group peptidase (beta-lactamase class C family) [Tenggerimyces flavus]
MAAGGLSETRLARLHSTLSGHVEAGRLAGAVTLISRRGEVHVDAVGSLAPGGAEPMRRDSIFRIASLTKPVVAVLTLMLAEECLFSLDEPVARLLPELASPRVIAAVDGPLEETVPVELPITVRDLLTFRNGLGMLFSLPPSSPLGEATAALSGFGPPQHAQTETGDEWLARLAALPLMYQPGSRWLYNTGLEILGVLLSRAAGTPLPELLAERVFGPLGMIDTGFTLPATSVGRLTSAYGVAPSGELVVDDPAATSKHLVAPTHPSAGAGLLSTIDDFSTFTELLRHFGRRGADRLLSRPSVEAMLSDQLTPAQKAVSGFWPGYFDSRGWGFGLAVGTTNNGHDRVGRYGWDGGSGTTWFTDPAEELTAILFTQRGGFPMGSPIYLDFWASVYAAIDD